MDDRRLHAAAMPINTAVAAGMIDAGSGTDEDKRLIDPFMGVNERQIPLVVRK